jgi:DNA replication protein DnaC
MPVPENRFIADAQEMIKRFVPAFPISVVEPMTDEERAARVAVIKKQEKEDQRNQELAALRRLGIPPRYYGATMQNWEADTPEKKAALDLIVKNIWTENLFITGNAGTGKTHLAYVFVRQKATYRRLPDIFRDVRRDFNSEKDVLDDLGSCRLLIIDEIGRQNFSQFEMNLFFEVVDRRYNNMLPTTLITNMNEIEFAGEYGTAVMDRLRPILVNFTWKSRRQ